MIESLFQIIIFPGILFLVIFGLAAEYVDRIIYARLQNRLGPPWFQPLADFIKLLSKEDLVPEEADPRMFKILPIFAFAAVVTAFLYVPLWNHASLFHFSGDLIVVIYLLTIPTLSLFLAGWHSTSPYAMIGAVRNLTQLFAYEVPLFMGLLAPAMLANSWSMYDITQYYYSHPLHIFINVIGFVVSMVALQGKLEKVPFDAPEAETEIVAGPLTEYTGKLLAFFRITLDMEMIVVASIVAALYMPFGLSSTPITGFIIYIIKILLIIFIISLARTVLARLRIDQTVKFCWKYLAPLALLQIVINFIVKGFLR